MSTPATEHQARALLGEVRAHIEQQDASSALARLLQAVQLMYGPAASHEAAAQFRSGFEQRGRALDDLSAMVERLQLHGQGDLHASSPGPASQQQLDPPQAILEERVGGMSDACRQHFTTAHASSFVCPHCGGVVANTRRDHHLNAWCPALPQPP